MAASQKLRWYLLVTLIVCSVVFSFTSAGEDDDYEPLTGPLDKHPDVGDEDHSHEGGEEGHGFEGAEEDHGFEGGEEGHGYEGGEEGHGHEGGEGSSDPTHIVDGALQCFHGKHIYSQCDESCRLTPGGELHVPHDHVDEFCNGPCLEETNLLLDCIDGIMDHFEFFDNKATTHDIRDTILTGCGHGEKRGDFDVGEHIESDYDDGSISCKTTFSVFSGIVISIICQMFLLL